MRALVIGGNGFIGSHLVEGLRARDARVRVLDPGPARDDLDWHGVEYRQGDFGDPATVGAALDAIDVVFHLASTTVPATSNLDPARDVSTNLLGTLSLLEAMKARGVRRILFLSSGGTVYGNPDVLPVPEHHPLRPISSYGVVKVAIEGYLNVYRHMGVLDPLVLRPSNPYGPRQSASGGQGVIAAALAHAAHGTPMPLWGDGTVVRDYLFIGDLVALAIDAALSAHCGVFNAGSGAGHSLNAIIAAVEAVTGRPLQLDRKPSRGFDVREVVLDISAARDTFGWQPRVGLDAGLSCAWQSLSLPKPGH